MNIVKVAYLATPYAKYPAGHEQAYIDACAIAGHLLQIGVFVYCPIAHSHGLAIHAEMGPDDMHVWAPLNAAII
jgi:hypothetical protein